MSIVKLRSQPFTATASFPSGSEGLGVGITWGFDYVVPRTAEVVEVQPGIWQANLVAPDTAGDYLVVWNIEGDDDSWVWETLTVTTGLYIETPGEEPEPETPSEIALIRLEIGDEDAEHFTDEQLTTLLDQDLTVLATAAHACEILATRYAGAADITVDGQTIKRSQLAAAFAARAKALRLRAEDETGGNAIRSVSVSARL